MHLFGVSVSKVFKTHVPLFMKIAAFEDGLRFGPAAYNVAVRAVKSIVRPRQHC
jgi:hypothetical protein